MGGERKGHFAVIQVKRPGTTGAEVDSTLPLDLSAGHSAWQTSQRDHASPSPLQYSPDVNILELGDDIVNSISIHRLDSDVKGQRGEVVAVLTNNDMTVRIYSLTRLEQLGVLDFPFAMNHASISPDGRLLVAVGDEPYAFFYERTLSGSDMINVDGEPQMELPRYDWELLTRFALHMPNGIRDNKGYFTSAWSGSGRLCAVASESGYITVFDTSLLPSVPADTDEIYNDAVIKIIPSSRPSTRPGPGSIRTMCFAPEPWHLLVWSEQEERVCVADLRTGLQTRQILQLDLQAKDLERMEVTQTGAPCSESERFELDAEVDFVRRFQRASSNNDRPAMNRLAYEHLEANADRRRSQRRTGLPAPDPDTLGLTDEERRIIEGLRTTRQRQEAREQGATTPRTRSHVPQVFHRMGSGFTYHLSDGDFPALPAQDEARTTVPETALPSLSSLRAYMRERYQQPRRRDSVVLSSSTNSDDFDFNQSLETAPAIQPLAPLSASPARLPSSSSPFPDASNEPYSSGTDPWRTIESAIAAEQTRTAQISQAATRLRRERERAVLNEHTRREMQHLNHLSTQALERMRTRQLRDPPIQLSSLSRLRDGGTLYEAGPLRGAGIERQESLRTTGVAMSRDGRTLYVGTTDGIFEFGINIRERMGFPSVKLR